jgi:hypothetical protein
MRRAEDQIRKLGADLCASRDDGEQRQILAKLRITLHEYIESLRIRLAAYPYVINRRVHRADDQ